MTDNNGFSNPDLKNILGSTAPSATGSPEIRFVQHCMDYYSDWMVAHSARLEANQVSPGQTLVMVYERAPLVKDGLATKLGVPGERLFKIGCAFENGMVACSENLNAIVNLKPHFSDFNEAMSFILANLQDGHAFVMVLLAQRRIFVHYQGENLEEWINQPHVINIKDAGSFITPEIINQELDAFHEESTKTPLGLVARHMWSPEYVGHPKLINKPEKQVQSGLLLYLRGCFGRQKVFIDEEVPNVGGRLDIRLAYTAPKKATTILELKILDTVRNATANLAWAVSGVHQVYGYKRSDTEALFACIFDARRDKTDSLPTVYEEAKKHNVRVAHFDMAIPPHKKAKAPTSSNPKVQSKPVKKGKNAGKAAN